MKNTILILSTIVTSLGLMALGYLSWGNTTSSTGFIKYNDEVPGLKLPAQNLIRSNFEFHFEIGSRFATTITKAKLNKAKSIVDLVPRDATQDKDSFWDVNIVLLPRDQKRSEKGKDKLLNSGQLALLQSTDYSDDFCIEAYCKLHERNTGKTIDQCFVYYVTIVPERKAEFKKGQQALLNYLKEQSKDAISQVELERLQPGKVIFTVTRNGKVENVKLKSTSGYDTIDDTMTELISNLTGKWSPAANSEGEKVDQTLTFSFGLVGC